MAKSIVACFERMEDPRGYRGRRHLLSDIMAIAILAAICGASGFSDIRQFGKAKEKWLRTFLELPHGVPSCDTFERVFKLLRPEAFEACFRLWIGSVAGMMHGVLAVDGKTLRGSLDNANGKAAIHMVSAWAADNGVVFGQVAVDEKSNEITAIPELLKLLEIKGLIVTIDAMGCQTKIAEQIVKSEADYVLAVKDNQKNLHEDIKETFRWARSRDMKDVPHAESVETEKGHGRIETRKVTVVWTTSLLREAAAWAGLKCIVEVESERKPVVSGKEGGEADSEAAGKTTIERRYYISSVITRNAAEIARAIRAHWGIENGLHWRLDVAFREDESRVRAGHAAENLSRVQRIALDLLMMEPEKKSIRQKRLCAGWNHDYLLSVVRMGAE